MENTEKKTWNAPVIVDLDVDSTEAGSGGFEDGARESSYPHQS